MFLPLLPASCRLLLPSAPASCRLLLLLPPAPASKCSSVFKTSRISQADCNKCISGGGVQVGRTKRSLKWPLPQQKNKLRKDLGLNICFYSTTPVSATRPRKSI